MFLNISSRNGWHSKVLRTSSKFLDLSSETQMEQSTNMIIHQHRGETNLFPWHVASNLSLLSHWDREFTSNHQMPTPRVAWVNPTKEEYQQWKIHPEVDQTIMDFNTPKKFSFFKTPKQDLASCPMNPTKN